MGRRCRLFRCDLNDHDETAALIPRVREHFPDLSVLVNNASVFKRGSLRETGRDLFERHFNINFKAPFFLTQAFAEGCARGQVINLLDTRVSRSDPHHAAYTLSKKALLELTRMAARELGPAIRVNGVSPGMILPPPGGVVDDLERRSAALPLNASATRITWSPRCCSCWTTLSSRANASTSTAGSTCSAARPSHRIVAPGRVGDHVP